MNVRVNCPVLISYMNVISIITFISRIGRLRTTCYDRKLNAIYLLS